MAEEIEVSDSCLCIARPPRSTDLEPPEPVRNRRCPIHGDLKYVDPDGARDEMLDRKGQGG